MEIIDSEGKTEVEIHLFVDSAVEGSQTVIELAKVFEEALQLAHDKAQGYGPTWRKQGFMGNFARIMSKVSRIRNMFWQDFPTDVYRFTESAEDNAMDLVNLSAFFLINGRKRISGARMFEADVHMDVNCAACGKPVGPEPDKNCIGEAIKTPSGLELLKVYHKSCAPRGLIWSTIAAMWRHN